MNAALILTAVMVAGLACSNPIFLNATAPLGDNTNALQGTVRIAFVNETNFRVVTYWGGFNTADLTENVQVQKLVLEAGGQSDQPTTLTCTRQIDIAGTSLQNAVTAACLENISPEDINEEIIFSDVADPAAANAEEPTAGTAASVRYYIGIDYACGDFIEIHFKKNPATGVFYTEIIATEQ
jgi:hypothetical protein